MSTLAEIEVALPMLSAEELARVEVTVYRLFDLCPDEIKLLQKEVEH